MEHGDSEKINAYKDFAEALSLELCFGYKSNIPVDFKTLDYYKRRFDDAMAKKTCISTMSDGTTYLAKRYFKSMDFDISEFPKKAQRYYNLLKDAYDKLFDDSDDENVNYDD